MTSGSASQPPTAGDACPSCGVSPGAPGSRCPHCGRPWPAATPEADITGWVKTGWALFLSNIPMAIGLALLVVVPGIALFMFAYFGVFGLAILADSKTDVPSVVAVLLVAILGFMLLAVSLAMPALKAGVYACFLQGIRTGKLSADNIWDGFRNWWSCTWIAWALGAATVLCMPWMLVLVGIPLVLAVQSLLWLSLFRIVDEKKGGIEALSFAWDVMRRRGWMLLVYTFAVYVVVSFGGMAMWLGAIVTTPIGIAVFAAAYDSLRREQEPASGP